MLWAVGACTFLRSSWHFLPESSKSADSMCQEIYKTPAITGETGVWCNDERFSLDSMRCKLGLRWSDKPTPSLTAAQLDGACPVLPEHFLCFPIHPSGPKLHIPPRHGFLAVPARGQVVFSGCGALPPICRISLALAVSLMLTAAV